MLRSDHGGVSSATGVGTGLAMSDEVRRRIRVNPILCNGYGYCAEIVPELISVDDWGFPIVSTSTIEDGRILHLAERAVATCPRLALLLEDVRPDGG
jgi:ferredoxin